MRIFLKDDPRAALRTQKIQDQSIKETVTSKYERSTKYEMRSKVLGAVALPFFEDVSIVIKWGDMPVETSRRSGANGCVD